MVGSRVQVGGGTPPKLERKGMPVAGKPEARRIRPVTWPWLWLWLWSEGGMLGDVSVFVNVEEVAGAVLSSIRGFFANPLMALLATAPPYECAISTTL